MRTLTEQSTTTTLGRSPLTPEHLQLLSDARLRALAGEPDAPARPAPPSPLARLAGRELRRRHGGVPAH